MRSASPPADSAAGALCFLPIVVPAPVRNCALGRDDTECMARSRPALQRYAASTVVGFSGPTGIGTVTKSFGRFTGL
ncbi:hypothetical protein GCM10007857_05860 [Bradyrhizobium iriomotense]|uniref:Secreted protein n=1 Tax=Bradyrhizobium iriomotense TaxID=441950 RepID=A0ABQ6AQM8_9BRAD|nr:hypothetical protein GCM10007857_05860 [Bradyrhizobium iriomotense]